MQLDDPSRGFSFRNSGPSTCAWINRGRVTGLAARKRMTRPADVIYRFGEERRSRWVARAILAARSRRVAEHSRALPRRQTQPAAGVAADRSGDEDVSGIAIW